MVVLCAVFMTSLILACGGEAKGEEPVATPTPLSFETYPAQLKAVVVKATMEDPIIAVKYTDYWALEYSRVNDGFGVRDYGVLTLDQVKEQVYAYFKTLGVDNPECLSLHIYKKDAAGRYIEEK
jgi:hypothetical protein